MKNQVVIIHGGDTFEKYEEYISYLKDYKIDNLDYFKKKRWGESLQKALGENFEVIAPKMPNKRNARYAEWKIWFEKIIPFLNDGVILVGGSLGGIFLTKYLSENIFPKKIKGVFLIAAPFSHRGIDYSLVDFILPPSLEKLSKQGGKLHFYHSKDDPVVSFTDMEKYQKQIPTAQFSVFEDREHFGQEEFPEIIKDIKNLTY